MEAVTKPFNISLTISANAQKKIPIGILVPFPFVKQVIIISNPKIIYGFSIAPAILTPYISIGSSIHI